MRSGFKQTDVGLIPDTWNVSAIGTLTTEFRGGAPLKPADFKDQGVKVLPKGGVGRSGKLRIAEKEAQYCSPEYADAHPRNQVDQTYTIVVLRDLVPSGPSIGRMVEIDTNERFVLAQGVYGFKVNPERADARYLIQLSHTDWYRNLANSIMVGSTQVHITNTAYKKAQLPMPPLAEQRAIAAALSDVDALLARLDALITKKRDLKQAAMQQLLTGRTRLPGFSGKWEIRRLDSLADIRGGGTPSTTNPKYWNGNVPWCTPTDITALGGYKYLRGTYRSLTSLGMKFSSAELVPTGSVVMTSRATIGECAINTMPTATNQGFKNFVPYASTDGEFLYYLLQTKKQDFIGLCSGSTFLEIGKTQLARFEISVPNRSEQRAIAQALSEMDTELAALEARRVKTRALKQGMMQELLTGRIRLV